jgi:hypothetical protein
VHPTGNNPQSVLIVALGPTKLDLLEMTTGHEPPDVVMNCDEVWGINAGCNHLAGRVAYDMLWVMDYLDGEERRLPRYAGRIRQWRNRHERPVMTSQAGNWADEPHIHEYPLQWVADRVGTANAYWHNSLPYLLAYAWCIGVQELVIWGADYSHEASKRREEDRANAEYWIGFCRAKGMTVWLPNTTTLCNTSRGAYFYGYRDLPEIRDNAKSTLD